MSTVTSVIMITVTRQIAVAAVGGTVKVVTRTVSRRF
jgi:hypothetical protein